ncbi:MAG TPA: amidohydrolase family protein, partial [Woeseiaceae bacterium]|nr:amidohydrolase family protein [Woeseiaceae bacterium]
MNKILITLGICCLSITALADSILIENVRIFDGVDAALTPGHVLVEDGIISKVSTATIEAGEGTTVIDGANRVLTPGFIDLHVHLTSHVPYSQIDAHGTVVGAVANDVARHFLDSGFTTVRDAGGTHPDFAKAIELGTVYGPRVFPSGATLSQTGGHGDWRHSSAPNPTLMGG